MSMFSLLNMLNMIVFKQTFKIILIIIIDYVDLKMFYITCNITHFKLTQFLYILWKTN